MVLTDKDWQIVDNIARTLTGQGVDRNELGKAMSYFRRTRDKERFLTLLARLPDSDYIRSNRTQGYFRTIHRTLEQALRGMDDEKALVVVAWAFRMMTYYQFDRKRTYLSHR